MSSDRRRLNLSLSMQSPQEQEALLDVVRKAVREELGKFHIEQRTKEIERPQAGEVDESILGFLRALQEGDDAA